FTVGVDDFTENLDEFLRYGTRLTVSDNTTVNFDNRNCFGCGTGEEHFVGIINFKAGKRFFQNSDSFFTRQFNDGVAGNAAEGTQPSWRCVDYAVFHEEYVVSRA